MTRKDTPEMKKNLAVGLFGIGLDTYWPQFAGLKARLEGYLGQIDHLISSIPQVTTVNVGLIDNPERAGTVGSLFRHEQVDIIFMYISTYALSSTVLPIVQEARVPVVVLNIQPVAAIDYEEFNKLGDRGVMTGEWLAHCQACSVPEVANVFNRAGIDYHLVTGYLGDGHVVNELQGWIAAAMVAKTLRQNRLGVMGHYYGGMLDVYSDMTKLIAAFGGHIEIVEIDEVAEFRRNLSRADIDAKIREFNSVFQVASECELEELERAAATSAALDKTVDSHKLTSLAYYYEGTSGSEHENIITSVIAGNTLLTASGVPVAGEYEVKNAFAMKILDSFGIGGSFSEFYAMDFNDDIVMLGHDGPGHIAIAEGPVGLVPLPVYHGKPGKGLSIQMTVKHGPVTILSVVDGPDGVFLLVAEGESVPGPVLNIGNTNSRYRFSVSARDFIESWSKAGPSHHSAIGIGHIADRIDKLSKILGIPVKRVC
jgi:L-arabinose isomerase